MSELIGLSPDQRRLDIEHTTVYQYRRPVKRSSHRLRLHPVEDRYQRILDHRIEVSVEGTRYEYEDVFGNHVVGFEIDIPYEVLTFAMSASVEVRAPVDRAHHIPRAHDLPPTWTPWQEHMMHSYLLPPELPESQLHELIEYARSLAARNKGELAATLDDIAWTIHSDYAYKQGFTTVETTPYEVFRSRAGVCQDLANLMICLARMLNVPARYRVGYIYTEADHDNTTQPEAPHAWVEAYVPDVGWRGYDPTHGSRVGLDHVRVAVGRNYRDATPTSGVIHQGGGDDETLTMVVQVAEG
ncbi:MAG: transglutaminase family protein [Acidimicrobiia bacterium]|nr:transglutaminase family protein [Acidimicrobiia bacterium]